MVTTTADRTVLWAAIGKLTEVLGLVDAGPLPTRWGWCVMQQRQPQEGKRGLTFHVVEDAHDIAEVFPGNWGGDGGRTIGTYYSRSNMRYIALMGPPMGRLVLEALQQVARSKDEPPEWAMKMAAEILEVA